MAPYGLPKEAGEFPEALVRIDVALRDLGRFGPSPEGYKFKTLGKSKGGLWQLNLHLPGRQIRVLYAPYGDTIVVFRIHKKSSPQEQEREYKLAMKRKKEAEQLVRSGTYAGYDGFPTVH